MSDNDGGCLGGLIWIAIILILSFLIIMYVILPIAIAFAGAGGIYGGYLAIRNYVRAFRIQY